MSTWTREYGDEYRSMDDDKECGINGVRVIHTVVVIDVNPLPQTKIANFVLSQDNCVRNRQF